MGSLTSWLVGCVLTLSACEEAPPVSVPAPASSVSPAVAASPAPAARSYPSLPAVPACNPSSPRDGGRRALTLSVDTLAEKGAALREQLRRCLPRARSAVFPIHVSLAVEPNGHTCGANVKSAEPLAPAEAECLGGVTRAFRFPRSDVRSDLVVPIPP